MQRKKWKKKPPTEQSILELWDNTKESDICATGITGERGREGGEEREKKWEEEKAKETESEEGRRGEGDRGNGTEEIFEEIMAKKWFSN